MSSAASSPSPRLALRPEPAASVPHRPLLKPWYRVARTPGGMALEYGQVAVVFEGGAAHSLLPRLLGLLDGTRTADEVVALVGPAVEPATRAALARLAAHGLLTEGPALDEDDAVASLAAWLAAAGVAEPATAAVQVAALRVAVVGEGPVADRLPGLLASVGVAAVDRPAWERIGGQAGLVVVAPDAGELPRLEEWNESALREGVPWLQVLPPNGRFAAVGPLFVPGETACRQCFLLRRAANVEFGEELEHLERAPGAYPFPAPLAAAVAGLAAFLGLRWALGGDRMLAGAFYALELGSALALTYHRVHRVPRCPACSPTFGVAPPSPWFGESARAR
ncbi:MAG TPA: TOMM precursor leader peptide-binding protein [Gaiellaceae bacterium]|nr:TOMM precursor leader peptide-binding protein [Gaiellaceae bacterium]